MSQSRTDATRWARLKPEWRTPPKDTLPFAFNYLQSILSAEEYDRMVRQYQNGQPEVRIETASSSPASRRLTRKPGLTL